MSGHLYPEEEAVGSDALAARFDQLMVKRRPELHRRYDNLFSDFRVGFETEFYGKRPLDYVRQMIVKYRPEIVVASIHHVKDVPIDFSPEEFERATELCGNVEGLCNAYYDEQYQLIQFLAAFTNDFPVVLGHMDLIKLYPVLMHTHFTYTEGTWQRIERNIRASVDGGLVFEVNSRGFKKNVGQYPETKIIRAISQSGGVITIGDDSHAKADVGQYYAETTEVVREYFTKATVFCSTPSGGYKRLEVPLRE